MENAFYVRIKVGRSETKIQVIQQQIL